MSQLRFELHFNIVYINNSNDERGNYLIEKLFSLIDKFELYFKKQIDAFSNFSMFNDTSYIDPDIRVTSIKMCSDIIFNYSFVKKLY